MASNDGQGGPRPRGRATTPGLGGAPPTPGVDTHARTAYGAFVPGPSAPLARGFHPASAPQPAAAPAPALPQPFPHPVAAPSGSRFVPAGPGSGPAFSTARTLTPSGEITAVGEHAPGVERTGSSSGWAPPSETPTQVGGEHSGLRSIGLDTGTGVMTGQTLGERYRIVRKIGAGGMGEVWEAQHIVIKKPVAVKVLTLDPTLTNGAEQAERLMREARLVAAVRHDNVVDITDFGHTPMGAPYFVMELLSGETLKRLIETQGALAWPRARELLMQIADALSAAHQAGIIHRDIKPENVFVMHRGGREVVKIIDFGIAKTTMLGEEGRSLTQTGMVCGTPAFMSPEQARGEKIDERTDIYSFGCLAYQMLVGRQPFVASTPADALYQQLFVEPTPMRQLVPHADLPPNLDAIVLTCMRKNRNLRFQSMDDVHRALETLEHASAPLAVPHEEMPVPPTEVQHRFAGAAPGMSFTDERFETGPTAAASAGVGGGLVVAILGGALLLGAGGGAGWYFFVREGAAADAEASAPSEPAPDGAVVGDEPAPPVEVAGAAEDTGEPEFAGSDAADGGPATPEPAGEEVPMAASSSGSRPAKGGKDPAPIEIAPTPVYYDKDHVAKGQGPDDPLPTPPPLPDAEPDVEPAPAPAPAPEPEPEPEPEPKPKPEPNKKSGKVDDLRDPWERG